MAAPISSDFIQQVNENLGIAHKVGRIYFPGADDRQDFLQEIMYQLWRSYPHFDGRSKFSTWMYRVCLNTALTYKRRSKMNLMESLSTSHHQIADFPSTGREESIALLMEAVATLTPVNKAIILLYLENISYEEIATITDLSKSNVGVRLVRIKKELEIKLKEKINT